MKPVPATQLHQEPSNPSLAHSPHDHTAHHHPHAPALLRKAAGHDTSPMVSGVFSRLVIATAMAASLWLALVWALK